MAIRSASLFTAAMPCAALLLAHLADALVAGEHREPRPRSLEHEATVLGPAPATPEDKGQVAARLKDYMRGRVQSNDETQALVRERRPTNQ
jgi:hypothetical protein